MAVCHATSDWAEIEKQRGISGVTGFDLAHLQAKYFNVGQAAATNAKTWPKPG